MSLITIYIAIAFLLSILVLVTDSGQDKNKRIIDEKRDDFAVAILLALWPITIFITIGIYINELYKIYYTKKIIKIVEKYNHSLEASVKKFSTEELKTLLKGNRLGVLYLEVPLKQALEQRLTDKSFEEHFFNNKED